MAISGLGFSTSAYRNLFVNKTEETDDEKMIKKLNNDTDQLNTSQIAFHQMERTSRSRMVEEPQGDAQNEQAATLDVNYGVGQNIPNHSIRETAPQDFTFDFKKENDFNLVGARNKLEDIDVEKGISDMKKDSVLDQYKYFVNPSKLGSDQDGTVKIVGWD